MLPWVQINTYQARSNGVLPLVFLAAPLAPLLSSRSTCAVEQKQQAPRCACRCEGAALVAGHKAFLGPLLVHLSQARLQDLQGQPADPATAAIRVVNYRTLTSGRLSRTPSHSPLVAHINVLLYFPVPGLAPQLLYASFNKRNQISIQESLPHETPRELCSSFLSSPAVGGRSQQHSAEVCCPCCLQTPAERPPPATSWQSQGG